MKKLIILSLLSISSITSPVVIPNRGNTDNIAIKAIRAAKNSFRKAKNYVKETSSDIGWEIKDIAQEVGGQFKEVGHDIYDATLAPLFQTTKETATRVAHKAKDASSKIGSATKNSYQKVAKSEALQETKQIARDVKDQLTEIGSEVYESGIKTPAIVVSEKAAAIAAAIKAKIIAAKNATVQAAKDAKNSEFAQDMADVGAQFKEAATDVADFVTEKAANVWNKTKDNVQAIREELAN